MRRSREALTADDYPQQMAELIAFDDESFPAGHPFGTIRVVPFDVPMPPLWLLGSSEFSGQLAAQLGSGIRIRGAHQPGAWRSRQCGHTGEQFVPSARYPEPHGILTVSVTIGETPEHAADLSLVNELFLLRLRTGQLGRYPTLEEAKTYQFTEQERALIASMPLNFIAGTADQVYREVMDLAELCQADEVMITTTLPAPRIAGGRWTAWRNSSNWWLARA